MKKILETERLILRETSMDDFDSLYQILSDKETMKYYPKPYDEEGTKKWINWCLDSYKKYGFGLWAVVLKESNEYIGDCGLSMQFIDGVELPEIGYHINKKYHHMGYASEAAKAVKEYIFKNYNFDELFTYMKYSNSNSYFTAIKNDMSLNHECESDRDIIERIFSIKRNTYEIFKEANEKMILRKALLKDTDNILNVVKNNRYLFPCFETKDVFIDYKRHLLNMINDGRCNIAIINNEVAGVVLYSKKDNEIYFLLVQEKYQRMKVGTYLMKTAISDLDNGRDITLSTYVKDDARSMKSRPFYKSLGFIEGKKLNKGIPQIEFILKK